MGLAHLVSVSKLKWTSKGKKFHINTPFLLLPPLLPTPPIFDHLPPPPSSSPLPLFPPPVNQPHISCQLSGADPGKYADRMSADTSRILLTGETLSKQMEYSDND